MLLLAAPAALALTLAPKTGAPVSLWLGYLPPSSWGSEYPRVQGPEDLGTACFGSLTG
jgi:hypothetical protein